MTTCVARRRLLVDGAHAADFVWRAGGVIAKHTAAGWEATVVALSYGERGESGELWREEGQTVERVKQIRNEAVVPRVKDATEQQGHPHHARNPHPPCVARSPSTIARAAASGGYARFIQDGQRLTLCSTAGFQPARASIDV